MIWFTWDYPANKTHLIQILPKIPHPFHCLTPIWWVQTLDNGALCGFWGQALQNVWGLSLAWEPITTCLATARRHREGPWASSLRPIKVGGNLVSGARQAWAVYSSEFSLLSPSWFHAAFYWILESIAPPSRAFYEPPQSPPPSHTYIHSKVFFECLFSYLFFSRKKIISEANSLDTILLLACR